MVKFLIGATAGIALGARLGSVQEDLENLQDFITKNLEQSEKEAERVSKIVDKHWPLSENTDDKRRMKASQLLSVGLTESEGEGNTTTTTTLQCKPLKELECYSDVKWAYHHGKHASWAGDAYYELPAYTGETMGSAWRGDWHKFFFCGNLDHKCSAPPCDCSNPPCGSCEMIKADFFMPDLGASAQCHAHTYCVGKTGDCCPNLEGENEPCCDFKPDRFPVGPPIAEYRAKVPAQEIEQTLHGGHYLGPLRETRCSKAHKLKSISHKMLHECPQECDAMPECKTFSFMNNKCEFFSSCKPIPSSDGKMLFVKNVDKMTPHWLPNRTVSGNSHHFFVIGDWGGESCPGKASMHYVFQGIEKGSETWNLDHNAQRTIAENMGTLGERVKPFMVVNAGDNFYWGGVPPRMMGGRGIHDKNTWQKAFENIYTHPSLAVPWVSILGNHDYGGDGCGSDVRAQFDYTTKDMLLKNRWKMPSPYYNHRVDFDDFSAEYFMLDTNIEDAFMGRHGGICKQKICWETMGRESIPYDDCKAFFTELWKEQQGWYEKALAASTADWKIVVMHHKPHGDVAKKVHGPVVEHGVQLMIGSHTHELAFFEKWYTAKRPLLVVGSGGGAQANPGCGGAIYCSRPHQYGFADVQINKKQITVSLQRHDEKNMMTRNICRDASVKEDSC